MQNNFAGHVSQFADADRSLVDGNFHHRLTFLFDHFHFEIGSAHAGHADRRFDFKVVAAFDFGHDRAHASLSTI